MLFRSENQSSQAGPTGVKCPSDHEASKPFDATLGNRDAKAGNHYENRKNYQNQRNLSDDCAGQEAGDAPGPDTRASDA